MLYFSQELDEAEKSYASDTSVPEVVEQDDDGRTFSFVY